METFANGIIAHISLLHPLVGNCGYVHTWLVIRFPQGTNNVLEAGELTGAG
jgi:hypothetical protein